MAREGQMRICLQRREFVAAFGGGAAAWLLAAREQQRQPVIGLLNGISFDCPTSKSSARS
jgi:hypothetical protein